MEFEGKSVPPNILEASRLQNSRKLLSGIKMGMRSLPPIGQEVSPSDKESGNYLDVNMIFEDILTLNETLNLDQTGATEYPKTLKLLKIIGKDPRIQKQIIDNFSDCDKLGDGKPILTGLELVKLLQIEGWDLGIKFPENNPKAYLRYLEERYSPEPETQESSETTIVGGGLTQEARDLLTKTDHGGIPTVVTNNLLRIARENGISPADYDDKTPNEIIEMLREKGGVLLESPFKPELTPEPPEKTPPPEPTSSSFGVKPLAQWEIDSLLSAVQKEERNLLFEPTPEEIKRYNQPWQEIFGPEAELLNENSSKDIYRPKEHPEIVVKVAKAINNVSFLFELELEKEALLKLQDSKYVPRLLGIGPNYLVEEFIQGKGMRETFYVSDNDEAKCFPIKAGEGVNNVQKEAASWLISAMEALTEIHERGLTVTDFRWSHWLWNEEGQRTVIVNLKNAQMVGEKGNLSEENYAFVKQLQYNKDINTIMRLFLSNIKGFSQEMVFARDKTTTDYLAAFWLGGKTRLDKDGGEKLKQTASALETSGSLRRIIEMFTGTIGAPREAPSTQEYTQALKDYFDEVGILKKT